MPSRLNRVLIPLSRGMFELPWESRTRLLAEMSYLDDAGPAVRAFHDAGASAPVQLSVCDKLLIAETITQWRKETGESELPDGIRELRAALLNDLHDAVV